MFNNDILCSHCHAWRCHPADRFCGSCGENLLQAEISIEPVSMIYQDGEVPDAITTVIRNVRGGLGGTRFFWRDQTDTVMVIADLDQHELNQPNEHEAYHTKSTDLKLNSAVPMEWSLIHQVTANKEYCRAILSCGFPVPVLALEKADFIIHESAPLSLTLLHRNGGQAPIENITVSAYEEATALNLPKMDSAIFPFTLSQNEQYPISLPMTEDLWRVLQGRPQGLELMLAVQIKYVSKPLQLPLKLRVPISARPVLTIPDKVRALQGRSLHLPIRVENQGGESCRLTTVQVDIRRGPEVVHTLPRKPSHPYTLEAGLTYTDTIEIPLFDDQEQPLAPKLYQCDIYQEVLEEEIDNPKLTIELEIRVAENYTGFVSIDFGTTATAVAYHPQGNLKQSPKAIPLSNQGKFIPTAIAYYLDEQAQMQYCIGHDALALLDNQAISHLVYLDNIKWQLANPDPILLPDGNERTWEEVAIDYLKKIKEIIEEYTDIVAIVKQVVITQPSRFHPLLIRALNRVYRQAGLMPKPVPLGDQIQHHSLAESWPSLTACLPLPNFDQFRDETVGYKVLGENFVGQHALLTYDVGGGSTDMSLFLIEIENYANMQITELGTDGTGSDDHFFGNGFSGLLFKYLWPSCEMWLTRQGYDPKQFPITLPWQPLRPGAEQRIARENGRQCADFVLEHLQGDRGPFNSINLSLRNIGFWDDKDNEELVNLMTEFQEGCDASLAASSLTLRSVFDKEVNIPGGTHNSEGAPNGDGVSLSFAHFITEFIDANSKPMFERLQRLLHHPDVGNLKIYLLVTGRGAFFPLVGSMLWAHQERLRTEKGNQEQKLEQVRVDPAFAKTIVSQGACYLARLPLIARGIIFVPRQLPSLGLQGDLDPDTGIPQFIPLCTDLPTPADGWQVVTYPLRLSGPQTVSLTFYLSTDNKKVLSDNDKLLGEVVGNVDVNPGEAPLAHVMIKANREDCLEVYIGFLPGDDSQRDEYSNWNKSLLGHYEMIPGACAKA